MPESVVEVFNIEQGSLAGHNIETCTIAIQLSIFYIFLSNWLVIKTPRLISHLLKYIHMHNNPFAMRAYSISERW